MEASHWWKKYVQVLTTQYKAPLKPRFANSNRVASGIVSWTRKEDQRAQSWRQTDVGLILQWASSPVSACFRICKLKPLPLISQALRKTHLTSGHFQAPSTRPGPYSPSCSGQQSFSAEPRIQSAIISPGDQRQQIPEEEAAQKTTTCPPSCSPLATDSCQEFTCCLGGWPSQRKPVHDIKDTPLQRKSHLHHSQVHRVKQTADSSEQWWHSSLTYALLFIPELAVWSPYCLSAFHPSNGLSQGDANLLLLICTPPKLLAPEHHLLLPWCTHCRASPPGWRCSCMRSSQPLFHTQIKPLIPVKTATIPYSLFKPLPSNYDHLSN